MAARRFIDILPVVLIMLILVSVVLYLVPNEFIHSYLGVENRYLGTLLAALLGSAILMPGFISYPLAGLLLTEGVPYMVLSAFTTTLMMVGVLSFPVERAYLGTRVAVARNLISLVIALVIALVTGVFFGEVF
ncbi:permease [Chloroflexota bacterium]